MQRRKELSRNNGINSSKTIHTSSFADKGNQQVHEAMPHCHCFVQGVLCSPLLLLGLSPSSGVAGMVLNIILPLCPVGYILHL